MNPLTPILVSSTASIPSYPSALPDELGTDPALLDAADQAIQRKYPRMHSFLIIRGGKLIYEKYYNGHHISSLHDLRSATKSFMSILIGIAMERGEMLGLDSSVWEQVSKYAPPRPDPLWSTITLRHLLTMTSGLYWETGSKLGERFIHRFHKSRSLARFILRLPVQEERLGVFQYRSTDSHMLSILLTEMTGFSAFSYAQTHLFGPLGIHHAGWSASAEGHTMGHIGLSLTSRDMGKFGQMCLNGGLWEGNRIVSEEWLKQSFTPQSDPYFGYGRYGYQWWSGAEDGVQFTYAHGHGGQQIILIPSLDAVVVFTADSTVSRWRNPRQLLKNYIIPAIRT
ncbi:class C beta-lactamase-related serine hydrolase [Paenibacillus zeisoli]|uniref:Class C beta-lactamase-related serine hydrolase n=1 Tax=Paenibacillus zeisoli TaxID=2496267 RepID=A0A3S1B8B8_9BACL|nr:serine hydrolase [Paenibacillus zeisoli]RUT31622.1 class C beta-lactamase-related serine hydrolase [Paenibacillus zeisoli]